MDSTDIRPVTGAAVPVGSRTAADGGEAFVHYLDLTSTLRFFQRYKERSYSALDLDAAARVLDAGCGVGTDAFALAERIGPDGVVHGVDVDRHLVDEAVARAAAEGWSERARFHLGDVTDLPFPDGSFTACRADRVLVHVAEAGTAVRELARVCRPGGVVFVSDPDYATVVIDAARPELTDTIVRAYAAGLASPYVAHRLPLLFRQAGLRDVTVSADTFVVSDLAVAQQVLELDLMAERAVRSGAVDRRAADGWLEDLGERASRHEFFAAVTGFGVRGRKPGGPSGTGSRREGAQPPSTVPRDPASGGER
ncbi:methyltransferase domain-containing protein [Plantactinospora sp. B6F1]|uniref:methyltransferase domain-containing protein n=1 Tax=Plantactinospora sp. B6F1 TaxID=3158971 RepID=UPI0032D9295B